MKYVLTKDEYNELKTEINSLKDKIKQLSKEREEYINNAEMVVYITEFKNPPFWPYEREITHKYLPKSDAMKELSDKLIFAEAEIKTLEGEIGKLRYANIFQFLKWKNK